MADMVLLGENSQINDGVDGLDA